MPDFPNPFSGMAPSRNMDTRELTRALRLDIAAEQEAIHLYEAQADATNDQLASRVLQDIADEERVHVGELQKLLNIVLENEESLFEEGLKEVDEMAEELQRKVEIEQSSSKDWYRIAQKSLFEDDKPKAGNKTGPTPAQMSIIVAKYNALSEFMANMLGRDSDDLIYPGSQAVQETQTERDIRNKKRRILREKLRKKKYEDWGGLLEDKYGKPLTGLAQERKEKEFKERFKEYLDAGTRLVLWQSKDWDPIGNITLFNADNITDEDVEKEMKAKKRKELEDRALNDEDAIENNEEDNDVYRPNYDGAPLKSPSGPIEITKKPESNFVDLKLNQNNVLEYMKQAKIIMEQASADFKDIQKEYKIQTPEKINAIKNVILQLLRAKLVYENVIRGDFENQLKSISIKKLKDIEEALIIVGYPKILEKKAQEKPHTTLIPSKMDLPSEGPDAAQLSAIIRMRDAKTAIMCSGLDMDCEDLLLSKSDSMSETDVEREERNALRLLVRDEFRDKKFEEWGGLTDFSLTQKQQDIRKKELKQKFEEYMDAGLTLMWEKLKQASGNSYAEKLMDAADMITDDMIENRRRAIKIGLFGNDEDEEEIETEDPYKSTYDGTPINISKEYSDVQSINPDQYINLNININQINDDNVLGYTKQAVRAINEAELLLDKAKKIKIKGPEKDGLRKNAVLRFLEAYKIYESILKSNVNDPTVLRIANNKLKLIKEQLVIAGFPKILNI